MIRFPILLSVLLAGAAQAPTPAWEITFQTPMDETQIMLACQRTEDHKLTCISLDRVLEQERQEIERLQELQRRREAQKQALRKAVEL